MPDPESSTRPDTTVPLGPTAWVRIGDVDLTFIRGSGPGGQAVNKVSTAARLRVAATAIEGMSERARARLRRLAGQRLTAGDEIVILAREHRSQADNRRTCLERLAALVEEACRAPRVRKKSRPTRAMIRRRLAAKRRQSDKKQQRRDNRSDHDGA